MRRVILVILFVSILSGCAPDYIKPEKLNAIRNIGAISILGNELCTNYTGTTIFTNKSNKYDAKDWKIDKYIQDAIAQVIKEDGRFQYINLAIDSSDMQSVYGSNGTGCRTVKPDISLIKDQIQSLRNEYNIDTLILVLEYQWPADGITGRSALLYGYGIHQSSFMGLTDTVSYIVTHLYVIDTLSSEILAKNFLIKHDDIDDNYFALDLNTLSKETIMFIENSIKSGLQNKIADRFKYMDLVR